MKKTHWRVITGAPCSGKTSVVRKLEKRGFPVVHEAARAHIDTQLKKGRSLASIKSDRLAFERSILHAKVTLESRLPTDRIIFLDRAIPDSIAYFILEGLNPVEAIRSSRLFRYRTVFIFDRLGYETDQVRSEDDRTAARLDAELELGYRHLGYSPIRVPLMSIQKRLRFVLDAC